MGRATFQLDWGTCQTRAVRRFRRRFLGRQEKVRTGSVQGVHLSLALDHVGEAQFGPAQIRHPPPLTQGDQGVIGVEHAVFLETMVIVDLEMQMRGGIGSAGAAHIGDQVSLFDPLAFVEARRIFLQSAYKRSLCRPDPPSKRVSPARSQFARVLTTPSVMA
jgi:hypothetical protein